MNTEFKYIGENEVEVTDQTGIVFTRYSNLNQDEMKRTLVVENMIECVDNNLDDVKEKIKHCHADSKMFTTTKKLAFLMIPLCTLISPVIGFATASTLATSLICGGVVGTVLSAMYFIGCNAALKKVAKRKEALYNTQEELYHLKHNYCNELVSIKQNKQQTNANVTNEPVDLRSETKANCEHIDNYVQQVYNDSQNQIDKPKVYTYFKK